MKTIDFSGRYILSDNAFMRPAYRISPFSTIDIKLNANLPVADSLVLKKYLYDRFVQQNLVFTDSGRAALYLALRSLNLNRNDSIAVITTSQNKYISSCVTKEIEKFCSWGREITANTKAILINHEFGFECQGIDYLYDSGLPIIEDYAHSFSAPYANIRKRASSLKIFSLPKFFPVQYGGLLVSSKDLPSSGMFIEKENYLRSVLSYYLPFVDSFCEKRIANHNVLKEKLLPFGFRPRFAADIENVPGVFIFSSSGEICLDGLKNFMQLNGVESSVFYGENAFFIPVHQRLDEVDMDYFVFLIDEFRKTSDGII